ncbi:MAG TPA: ATP synthase subunit I [Nitrospirota bacterium]
MTTDDARKGARTVAAIVRGVAGKTAIMVSLAAAAALVFSILQESGQRWWLPPASVLFGGALGILNFRWLALSVQRIYLRQGVTSGLSMLAATVISVLKLALIFIILFIVIKWRLLHVVGLVTGLTVCFLAILWEGIGLMKKQAPGGDDA